MRIRAAILSALVLASAGITIGARGAPASTGSITRSVESFGTPVTNFGVLPAGVWNAVATGTYTYDDLTSAFPDWDSQQADAECSTASPFGDGLLDVILAPDAVPLAPTPVAEWQRYRYLIIATGMPGLFLKDPLDLQIDGLPINEWVPASPTIVDHNPDGVVALCDTATHSYETVFLSDGDSPTTFRIYDPGDLFDNNGQLSVTVHQVA
jgi:hypothetical protein